MSGGSSQAPTAYQPTNQAGADQGFQSGANSLSSAGSALSGQAAPAYAAITSNVANNPYYSTAQQYATQAANTASGTVAPQQFSAAASQFGTGNTLTGTANTIAGQNASGIGLNALNSDMSQASSIANSGYQQDALAALNQGFDPQTTLYNQQYQQQQDQQNAINAMNGVSGSPYAAGVSGQESQNFNTNWQNQQLSRESTAANTYSTLLNGATSAQSTLQGAGTSAYSGLTGAEASALSSLSGAAGNAYTTGSNLDVAGLTALSTAGQTQSQTYLQQQQAYIDALNAQVTGTTGANSLTQQGVADQGTYLGIGQTATQNADNATSINNQASASAMAGIGSLAGTAASLIPW